MGSRGPLRNPSSIRGLKEAKATRPVPVPVESSAADSGPILPDWLPEACKPFCLRIATDLAAAKVPLERADSDAIGMYALALYECQRAAAFAEAAETDAGKQDFLGKVARFARDAQSWANQIGATPASRARMNIKPVPPKPLGDEWDELDSMRRTPAPINQC